MVTIELDIETLVCNISATVPNAEVGLDMARRAVDEFKRICDRNAVERDRARVLDPLGKWPARFGRG